MERKPVSSNLIDVLLKPEFYPGKVLSVQMMQTQMSLIFLTGDYAYKIKKPVNLGYLDYTTLEKRRHFCYQELELNRRLSPDMYLEVLPITEQKGEIRLGGEGKIIEYAVKMKQLPSDRTMDNLLLKGAVTAEMVQQVAEKVAKFHIAARTDAEISSFGRLNMVNTNIEENRAQTEKYIDVTISRHEFDRINQYNARFTSINKRLFQRRVVSGRIRDCHGDLHTAHVCFSNGIQIFDCIEFNDRFRYCDVASEVAFLAMDLERYNRPDLSRIFVDAYIQYSDDIEMAELMDFYKCYRAYVRGKVSCFMLDDPLIKDKETPLKAAKNYFHLAHRYAREKPLLIIMSGLTGTGKSKVAEALSGSTGFVVLSSDIVRKNLVGISPTEHRFESYDSGIYSQDSTQRTYGEMFNQAKRLLGQGQSVILDATFRKRQERADAAKLAEATDADFLVAECILNEAVVKERLEERLRQGTVSDGRWEIFETQKKDSDKINEFPAQNHVTVDTILPVDENIKVILERI